MLTSAWTKLAQWALLLASGHRHGPQKPFPGDRVPGQEGLRLPGEVKPYHVDIFVTTDLVRRSYAAAEDIHITTTHKTESITLHAAGNLDITYVALCNKHAKHCREIRAQEVYRLPESERITLDLRRYGRLHAGDKRVLRFAWHSDLSDAVVGYATSPYSYSNTSDLPAGEVMAVTMFEPTQARMAFPSFDEPALKTSYALTMVHRGNTTALSNMPEVDTMKLMRPHRRHGLIALATEHLKHGKGWKVTSFAKSPPMSTYTFAFANGAFQRMTDSYTTRSGRKVPLAVYAGTDDISTSSYALQVMKRAIPTYEAIFDLDFPLPKMDILSARAYCGAMEHWGLIISANDATLWTPDKGEADKMLVVEVMAHELAHQWFGNIVTAEWWDDIWLNEAFATYASNTLMNSRLESDYETWRPYVVNDFNPSMILDEKRGSHPIYRPIESATDMRNSFDAITYKKGTRVLSTIAALVGQDNFVRGVSKYLQAHKYGSATGSDLWTAISDVSGQNVSAIARAWLYQTGHPIVSVERTSPTHIKLTQRRFLSSGKAASEEDYLWPLPLEMLLLSEDGTCVGKQQHTLSDRHLVVEPKAGTYLKLNSQLQGFYRTIYDSDHMRVFNRAMASPQSCLSGVDQGSIIADEHHAAVSGQADVTSVLEHARMHESSRTPLLWAAKIDFLLALQKLFWEQSEHKQDAVKAYAAGIIGPLYNELGFDARSADSAETRVLRSNVVSAAVAFDYAPAIDQVRRRFEEWVFEGRRDHLDPDVLALVLDNGVRLGGRREWQAMLDLLQLGHPVNATMARSALVSTSDPALVAETIDFLDKKASFSDLQAGLSALGQNVWAKRAIRHFMQQNFERVRPSQLQKRFGGHIGGSRWFYNGFAGFTTRADFEETQKFFDPHRHSDLGQVIAEVLEDIEISYRWLERDGEKIVAHLGSKA